MMSQVSIFSKLIHSKFVTFRFSLARLLKTSILPEDMKTFTKKEFRNAPFPAVGSASEQYQDEDEMMVI